LTPVIYAWCLRHALAPSLLHRFIALPSTFLPHLQPHSQSSSFFPSHKTLVYGQRSLSLSRRSFHARRSLSGTSFAVSHDSTI
jgi:hypothetical protein